IRNLSTEEELNPKEESYSITLNPVAPVVNQTTINPSEAGKTCTVRLTGSFSPNAKIALLDPAKHFSISPPTTYNPQELTLNLPAAGAGTWYGRVQEPGGDVSGSFSFTVNYSAPTLTSAAQLLESGDSVLTFTLSGTNVVPGCSVAWTADGSTFQQVPPT